MQRKSNKRHPNLQVQLVSRLVLALAGWTLFGYVLFFVEPRIWADYYYAPFFLLLYLSLSLSGYIFTSKLVLLILPPLGLIAFLFLRLIGFRDWFNPILIAGLVTALVYFFTADKARDKLGQEKPKETDTLNN